MPLVVAVIRSEVLLWDRYANGSRVDIRDGHLWIEDDEEALLAVYSPECWKSVTLNDSAETVSSLRGDLGQG